MRRRRRLFRQSDHPRRREARDERGPRGDFRAGAGAQRYDDLDEVAKAANDTQLRPRRLIWTRDVSAMHKLAAKLKAGMVWGNCHSAIDTALPFGGYKQSGFGREQGRLRRRGLYRDSRRSSSQL
jgi:hypothetical protein